MDKKKNGHEPAVCTCSSESQLYPGLHQRRGDQYCEGGDCPSLPSLDSIWSTVSRSDVEPLERVQRRATKITRVLEHLSCEDRLRELGTFSLKKRSSGEISSWPSGT